MHESCLKIHLNRVFFIVSYLTILNSGAVYRTFILYRQLCFVNKGGKTVNFRSLIQINVFNLEMFCFALKILWKCSLKAANSKF